MDDSKKNAYTILELQPGPDVDDAAIKKAYRRLAILKHPDKNRDNPNAAAEFAELEQAYRLLLDKAARGALDDLLRAQAQRAAREAQVGDKRRKLREELERRERQSTSERSEEEMARQRLKLELERLRRKMEEEERRQRQQAAELSAAIAAQRAAAADPGGLGGTSTSYGTEDGAASAAVKAQLRRTLKVTWDPNCREYGSEELRSIFSTFGAPVQDVVLRDRKKKRKATALVVMGTEAAAAAAANSVCGDPGEPLLVVPLVGDLETADEPQPPDAAAPASVRGAKAAPATTSAAAAAAATGGSSGPGRPDGDEGLLPRDGAGSGAAGPNPQSMLQRPARLPEVRSAARPLFPSVGTAGSGPRPAFPLAGSGPGLFPSASGTAAGTTLAGPGGNTAPSFASAVGQGEPAFGSWRTAAMGGGGGTTGRGGGGGGGGGSFEDEVLEKMRRAAAARQSAAAVGKETAG